MPSYRSVRKERPKKRFRIPSSYVQWGVLGLVGAGILFMLSRALCRPPSEPGPVPMLSRTETKLAVVTRLLGDVSFDSATLALIPAELRLRLTAAETLAAQGRWHDAIAQVRRLLRDARPNESSALHGLAGCCYAEAANPDWALHEFRLGLERAETSASELGAWLAFNAGFLFQSHGFADSCIPYYQKALSCIPQTRMAAGRPDWALLLANNLGVAYQTLKDSTRARELFELALARVDTLADPKSARVIKDNLARLAAGIRE
ncbi:MAG: hypothetical protein ABIK86_07795 [candidate division WOR-3 bacterium]